MVAVQVFASSHAAGLAGSQGNFQLDLYKPMMPENVVVSIDVNSLMLLTAFNPHIGYETAAKISLTTCRQDSSMELFDLWRGALEEVLTANLFTE